MSNRVPTEVQINSYAESYVLYGDQTRAFRAAFPKSKASKVVQHTKSCLMHEMDKVWIRIDEITKTSKKQSEAEFSLSSFELKQKLSDIVDLGMGTRADGTPFGIGPAVAAIDKINLMDGNYAATKSKVEHSGDVALRKLSDEELDARLEAMNQGNHDEQ